MVLINARQESLLEKVEVAYTEVAQKLKDLEGEYEYAVYVLKQPVIKAIEDAQKAGIPMSSIVKRTQEHYPQRLQKWMAPTPAMVDRWETVMSAQKVSPEFSDTIDELQLVTRDQSTGIFEVWYQDKRYKVQSYGAEEPWASRQLDIPDEVYKMIQKDYPAFVVLGEDD